MPRSRKCRSRPAASSVLPLPDAAAARISPRPRRAVSGTEPDPGDLAASVGSIETLGQRRGEPSDFRLRSDGNAQKIRDPRRSEMPDENTAIAQRLCEVPTGAPGMAGKDKIGAGRENIEPSPDQRRGQGRAVADHRGA